MVTYGTTTIPSDQITVVEGDTVDVSTAFERSMAVVGGMDTGTGTATEGETVEVDSPSDAQTKFGDGSELHEQAKIAFNNGVATLFMTPVSETTVTDELQSTASGTLDNAPIFDPNVNTEHSIAVDDSAGGSLTVNINYQSPPPTPADADTINVNPVTGEYEADAAPDGTDYEFDYDYGDYSAAIQDAVTESPRILTVLTESESVVNTAATEVDTRADSFDFQFVVAGAYPVDSGDTPANYTSTYSDGIDDQRVSLVSPSRGYVDDAETEEVRTMGAIGGYLASLPLGISSTNDSVDGLTGLRADFTTSQAGDLIDNQVLPLIDYPPVTIVKDMTTSTTQKFERVYSNQIVDEGASLSHEISRNFVGGQNTTETRNQLRRSHRNAYIGMRDNVPPLLDAFVVTVTEDQSDAKKVNVEVGLDVVDVMDTIDVTITVGDVVTNNGAT